MAAAEAAVVAAAEAAVVAAGLAAVATAAETAGDVSPQESQMTSKLYVSNLSQAATLSGMRELFGSCGAVLNVEFAAERGSRGLPTAAYITMADSRGADRALSDLHGRLHGDRLLMISRVAGDPEP